MKKRETAPGEKERFTNGFYFIGKVRASGPPCSSIAPLFRSLAPPPFPYRPIQLLLTLLQTGRCQVMWAKGYTELLQRLEEHQVCSRCSQSRG